MCRIALATDPSARWYLSIREGIFNDDLQLKHVRKLFVKYRANF